MNLEDFAERVVDYESRLQEITARLRDDSATEAHRDLYRNAYDPLLIHLRRLGTKAREGLQFEQHLLDTLPVIVLVLDATGNIVTFNRFMAELCGYSAEEVRGQSWFDSFLPSSDRPGIKELFHQAIAGEPVHGNINPILTRDGEQRLIEWHATDLRDANGNITGVLSAGRDITEQRRFEQDLTERQERYRLLFEAAIDPIIGINERGEIIACNAAVERAFGWDTDELIGTNVKILMGEPYQSAHDNYIKDYITTGVARAIGTVRKVIARRKSGDEFPAELSVSEVKDSNGRLRFVGVVRDVSEAEEIRAKLTQAERLAAIGELAAGVAHEVNNPVNTILNCAQLIKDGDTDPELCDDILHEGGRITTIVRNLLDFARGAQDDYSSVNLGEVVQKALGLVRRRITKSGVNIIDEIPAEIPLVRGRFQELEQVVLNLVLNARDALLSEDHSDSLRTIHIRVFEHTPPGGEPAVCLGVRDNGPGIRSANLARIFEPFFTTKKSTGGTGLGLSVSHGIIESHGGELTVESKTGEFTEMQVTLPAKAPEAPSTDFGPPS